jgi:cobalt-zinc-cadmium efflux system outer membrane protein
LGDVLARTAELNPELLALGFGREAADGRVAQAGMGPNPNLSLSVENFGGTRLARGSDVMELTVQASQLIERGDKAGRRVAFAERERDVTQASLALRRSDILAASANAFAKALAEATRLAFAGEQLKLTQETFASASRRLQAAIASPSEVARARAALASAQAEFARAQSASSLALASLAASWGGSASEIAEVKGALRLPAAPPALARFESALAVSGNPRLGLVSAMVAGQRAALELESARGVADVTLGAGVRRLNEGPATAFVVGASIPLTFRDDNSGNIRAARAMLRANHRGQPRANLHGLRRAATCRRGPRTFHGSPHRRRIATRGRRRSNWAISSSGGLLAAGMLIHPNSCRMAELSRQRLGYRSNSKKPLSSSRRRCSIWRKS